MAMPTPAPITVTATNRSAAPPSIASRAKPTAPRAVPTRSRVAGAHFERGTMTLWASTMPMPAASSAPPVTRPVAFASRARRSCTRKPVTTWMRPSAVNMPNPATRKGQTRGSAGRTRAGSATSSVRSSRRRTSTTTSSPPSRMTGTMSTDTMMEIPASRPPTRAPAIEAMPWDAPTPAMPRTRSSSLEVTSAT